LILNQLIIFWKTKIQMLKMEDEIEEKRQQMSILKQRMIGIGEASANGASLSDLQQVNKTVLKTCHYH
jgi:hypothetical protein